MIGGDVMFKDIGLDQIRGDRQFPLFLTMRGPSSSKNSLLGSIMLMIKAIVSTIPFLNVNVLKTGVVQCALICILMGLLTQGSVQILVHSWKIGEAYTHAELWGNLFHASTNWFPTLLIAFGYIAVNSFSYVDIMDCVTNVVPWLWPSVPELVYSPWFIQYVSLVLAVLPTAWAKSYGNFLGISLVSHFAILVGLACVAVYLFRTMFEDGKYTATSQIVLFQFDFQSIFKATRSYNMAFFMHPYIPLLGIEMFNPTYTRVLRMSGIAILLSGMVTWLVPMLSYLLFLDGNPSSSIFLYLDRTGAPEVVVGAICVGVIAICSNMAFTFLTAQTLVEFLHDDDDPSRRYDRTPRLVAAFVSSLFAIAINMADVTLYTTLLSLASICSSMLGSFLPAVYYLKRFGFKIWKLGLLSLLVLGIGGAITVIGVLTSIPDLITF
jgi:hypothetical protein